MARIISTTDLGNGLTKTVENRDARVVIAIGLDGAIGLTIEREQVTRINGEIVGGPQPAPAIPLSDAQLRAVPGFAQVYATIQGAGDMAEQAIADARAAAAVIPDA